MSTSFPLRCALLKFPEDNLRRCISFLHSLTCKRLFEIYTISLSITSKSMALLPFFSSAHRGVQLAGYKSQNCSGRRFNFYNKLAGHKLIRFPPLPLSPHPKMIKKNSLHYFPDRYFGCLFTPHRIAIICI